MQPEYRRSGFEWAEDGKGFTFKPNEQSAIRQRIRSGIYIPKRDCAQPARLSRDYRRRRETLCGATGRSRVPPLSGRAPA